MKKLLFMLLAVACGMQYGIYKAEQQEVKLQTEYKELSDVVVCRGLRAKECVETVDKAEELLPNELEEYLLQTLGRVEVFVGNNAEFLNYMSDKPIHKKDFAYAGIAGVGYEPLTIVYTMADDYVLMHELGHVYEYSFGYFGEHKPTDNPEWQRAYNLEFISAYGQTNIMEFYAECFAMYFRNPKILQRLCPLAYDLLDADFGHLE